MSDQPMQMTPTWVGSIKGNGTVQAAGLRTPIGIPGAMEVRATDSSPRDCLLRRQPPA